MALFSSLDEKEISFRRRALYIEYWCHYFARNNAVK